MEIVIQINNEIDSEQLATVADVDIATLEKKGGRSWTVRYGTSQPVEGRSVEFSRARRRA